jgi:uncharacterized short protein YbdD (DUF466 family)
MQIASKNIKRFAKLVWRGIREWCGDAAYERYLGSLNAQQSLTTPTLTAEEFYVEQLTRRYSRPNRCC